MPNNPARHKAGYVPVVGGERKVKRREYTSIVRTNNRLKATADLGAVNGGPSAVSADLPVNDPYANPLGGPG